MNAQELMEMPKAFVTDEKGLLAMDESNSTCSKRFAKLGIPQNGMPLTAMFNGLLQRAWRIRELAGFGNRVTTDPDLTEWNYGDYEGRSTAEISRGRPGWNLFCVGCPGGETAAQVGVRADRMIAGQRGLDGTALVFGHRHQPCVLAARWDGLSAERGHIFMVNEASVSRLGYDHGLDDPVMQSWNNDHSGLMT